MTDLSTLRLPYTQNPVKASCNCQFSERAPQSVCDDQSAKQAMKHLSLDRLRYLALSPELHGSIRSTAFAQYTNKLAQIVANAGIGVLWYDSPSAYLADRPATSPQYLSNDESYDTWLAAAENYVATRREELLTVIADSLVSWHAVRLELFLEGIISSVDKHSWQFLSPIGRAGVDNRVSDFFNSITAQFPLVLIKEYYDNAMVSCEADLLDAEQALQNLDHVRLIPSDDYFLFTVPCEVITLHIQFRLMQKEFMRSVFSTAHLNHAVMSECSCGRFLTSGSQAGFNAQRNTVVLKRGNITNSSGTDSARRSRSHPRTYVMQPKHVSLMDYVGELYKEHVVKKTPLKVIAEFQGVGVQKLIRDFQHYKEYLSSIA